MNKLSRNKQNELAFFSIYNYIVLLEMKETIDVTEILSNQCGCSYDEVDTYIKEVVLKCIKNSNEIVELIKSNLRNWTYDRVSYINKAILMYGITNGKYMDQLDKKLIIDISINLVKKYGDEKDYKFINGLLDNVL